jgi:hypothetical protein
MPWPDSVALGSPFQLYPSLSGTKFSSLSHKFTVGARLPGMVSHAARAVSATTAQAATAAPAAGAAPAATATPAAAAIGANTGNNHNGTQGGDGAPSA